MSEDIERLKKLDFLLPIEKTRDSKRLPLSQGNRKRGRKENQGDKKDSEDDPLREDFPEESQPGKILDILV